MFRPLCLSVQSVSASLAAFSWTLFQHSDHRHHCPSHHWRGHTTRNTSEIWREKTWPKKWNHRKRLQNRSAHFLCSAWVSFLATGPKFAWYLMAFAQFGAKFYHVFSFCHLFSLYVQHPEVSISCLEGIYSSCRREEARGGADWSAQRKIRTPHEDAAKKYVSCGWHVHVFAPWSWSLFFLAVLFPCAFLIYCSLVVRTMLSY